MRPDGSKGVYAKQPIRSGERLVVWGGEIVPWEALDDLPPEIRRYTVQVEEELYLVSSREGPADWINHACNPNAGLQGQITLVAMRNISAGKEICYDYAMSDGSPYDEFECGCGAANCRHWITGNDWLNPDLQQRYAGYFSPYLQRRIEQLSRAAISTRARRNGSSRRAMRNI